MNALKSTVKTATRGRPFTGKGDPRRCKKPPGRPRKEHCFSDILRRVLKLELPAPIREALEAQTRLPIHKDATRLEALCDGIYFAALSGEAWAVNFIADRTEGKVKDVLQVDDPKATEAITQARKLLERL